MSRFAFWRSRRALVAVAVLAVLVAGGLVVRLGGNDSSPEAARPPTPTPTSSAPAEPGPEPEPTEETEPAPESTRAVPAGAPTCEGPTTQFNVEGVEKDSLLPDCGERPVTTPQQGRNGLGLGCGGSYPVILYKTRTADSKSSVCGVNSSGEKLRVVVAADGGPARDLKGEYEYRLDAFVAKDGDTTYVIQAYDGTIVTRRDGQTAGTEKSVDWISLDNESDGEADYPNG